MQVFHASQKDKTKVWEMIKALALEHRKWEGDEYTGEEDEEGLKHYRWKEEESSLTPKFIPLVCKEVKTGELLGVAVLLAENKENWHILEFFIKEEHRRKGVGKFMVQEVIRFCSGAKTIEAASHVLNTNALKFWRAMGFTTVIKNFRFLDRTIYGVGSFDRNVLSLP